MELGTGIQTALTQIVVEELRLGMKKVDFVQGDTVLTQAAGTVGSKSIQQGGPLLRQAAATAYAALLAKAATYLNAPASSITASKGKFTVNGKGKSVTYDKLLTGPDVLLTISNSAPVVAPANYEIVGTAFPASTFPARRWPPSTSSPITTCRDAPRSRDSAQR